jgi:hypothetical protein
MENRILNSFPCVSRSKGLAQKYSNVAGCTFGKLLRRNSPGYVGISELVQEIDTGGLKDSLTPFVSSGFGCSLESCLTSRIKDRFTEG